LPALHVKPAYGREVRTTRLPVGADKLPGIGAAPKVGVRCHLSTNEGEGSQGQGEDLHDDVGMVLAWGSPFIDHHAHTHKVRIQ
jgi:hypothetical protein